MSPTTTSPSTAPTPMEDSAARPAGVKAAPLALVPRLHRQGYTRELVDSRRRWVEARTGARLTLVGRGAIPPENMRGNVENPIGAVQMPLGVAGPLHIDGEHAQGTFYVPLATTEGALVRSYERGMVALTRAGGARTRIWKDENRVAPVFFCADVAAARAFAETVEANLDGLRAAAQRTTRHGRLLGIDCFPVGREVIVSFRYHTADAQGMNMIVRATEEACQWIRRALDGPHYYIFSGYNSEKRASGALLPGGKGKKVTAGALLPRRIVERTLHITPEGLVALWHHTVLGHLQAGALGYNGHYANGLTALFIATGQDVANVANAAVGITNFETTPEGDLYASVTLPALTVATVGGGTGLGTSRECLQMLGCAGAGGAPKLAEIAAATVLAGELSMGGAISSGEFVNAHETYGRNRPTDDAAVPEVAS